MLWNQSRRGNFCATVCVRMIPACLCEAVFGQTQVIAGRGEARGINDSFFSDLVYLFLKPVAARHNIEFGCDFFIHGLKWGWAYFYTGYISQLKDVKVNVPVQLRKHYICWNSITSFKYI